MEETIVVQTAQDLYEFLKSIPESSRVNMTMDVYEEGYTSGEVIAEAIQIFEDGAPVSIFRISK